MKRKALTLKELKQLREDKKMMMLQIETLKNYILTKERKYGEYIVTLRKVRKKAENN